MVEPVLALGGAVAEAGLTVRIEELAGLGAIALRGDPADPAVAAALAAEVGADLPPVRRFSAGAERLLVWMSPDEFLLRLPRGAVEPTLARLDGALAGVHCLAADVSDARATFRLTGAGARATLAKGAPVDLSPRAFGPGDARRTHMGQIAVAFWQTAAAPDVFELVCARSVADYAFRWLVRAAATDADPGALP